MAKYLSQVAGEAQRKYEAEGVSTKDLEKRVFSSTPGALGNIKQLEHEVTRYERAVADITLGQYDGLTRTALTGLDRIGIPVVEWSDRQQARKLERVVSDLGERRTKYEGDVQQRHTEIARIRDTQCDAGILLQRYQAQLIDLKATLEEKRKDYQAASAEAARSDGKAHLAVRKEVTDIRADILNIERKRERAAAKVVETERSAELLAATQNQMYALLQKVQEAELRAKHALSEAHAVDSSKELSLPKTVHAIADGEVIGHTVRERAGRVDAEIGRTVEAIYSVDTDGGIRERDRERDTRLRTAVEEKQDAFLDEALRIVENL